MNDDHHHIEKDSHKRYNTLQLPAKNQLRPAWTLARPTFHPHHRSRNTNNTNALYHSKSIKIHPKDECNFYSDIMRRNRMMWKNARRYSKTKRSLDDMMDQYLTSNTTVLFPSQLLSSTPQSQPDVDDHHYHALNHTSIDKVLYAPFHTLRKQVQPYRIHHPTISSTHHATSLKKHRKRKFYKPLDVFFIDQPSGRKYGCGLTDTIQHQRYLYTSTKSTHTHHKSCFNASHDSIEEVSFSLL